MVFPFVVPDRLAEVAPPVMRFVLKADERFEIQSESNGKSTTHVEAKLERCGVRETKIDLEERKNACLQFI